jgi:ligand-binding sensor domain-containing protein/DNA-binding CsgD family transcriptional regulator
LLHNEFTNSIFKGKMAKVATTSIFFLFWLLLPDVSPALSGKYPIKNFAPPDYGAGIQNIDFAQNRDLSLFVANNLGVLSFNGSSWGKHALNTGKKQRSLAFDEKSNRLYVGSQGEFGFFESNWQYVSLLDKIPESYLDFDEVWDVLLFDSKVYFCTFQGIYMFDGESITVIRRPGGFNRSFVAGNRLFTQSPTGALFEIEGDKLVPLPQNGHINQVVAGVVRSEAGYVFFYNSGKIEVLNLPGGLEPYLELMKVLGGKYVNHVIQISDSRLVISTQLAGLYIYDQLTKQIENISISDGLISNACLRVFQDYSGNLWVGMQNGIALIDINSPLRLVNQNIDLQGSGYEAFETDEGTYFTTSNGIYFLSKGASKTKFLIGTEGPAYGMQLINNKLYAGHHTGLFLLEHGQAFRRAYCEGLWQIKQVRSNPQFAIAGTYTGLHLFQLDAKGELQDAKKIVGFNESSRFFEEDRKGRIWVGQYYKGLYLLTLDDALKHAAVTKVSDSYTLPIQKYIFLSRIDDQIYICSAKGIFKLDQATDKIVGEDVFTKVVGKNWVYQLVQDKQKNVYVYSENLVGFFKKVSPENYVYLPSSLFQLRQSFNNDLLNVSRHVRDGILFNANEGFIQYSAELEEGVSTTSVPLVSRVINVSEDSVLYSRMPFQFRPEKTEPIRITEGTRVLQFIVESFKFKDVSNQQFRYYLSGFDEAYSEWTSASLKEYTNLRVGSYQFFVQAFNSKGEIVTSQPLLVEVSPAFYKSRLAQFIYLVLVVLTLYMIYRFQRQYYRKKQVRMEQAKQEELGQKQKELQELKEVQIKSELNHVNTLLAASTMNLVVKNEFMETIKEEIRQAKATDKVEDKQRALEKIIKEIDTTLKVQEDWKQFEHHFDQIHGDFLKRLTREFTDLTPGEQKLCAFLRLNMDTKEIANLMAISSRGVEVTRYRLRKKFKLDTHQNLSKFILEY